MKDKTLWWALLGSVLCAEGYIVYEISQMMKVEPQIVVEVQAIDIDEDVDESIDENLYYQTLWRETNENDQSNK